MDARKIILGCLCLAATSANLLAQGSRVQSQNFIVVAATPQLAQRVADQAEDCRLKLAQLWLGRPLPDWKVKCPIRVLAGKRGAGGRTTFTMDGGTITHWDMEVEGTPERILDSVLPHEITHTVLASHFAPLGKPVPRWADEGASTWVEDPSEKTKHDKFLVEALATGRGIPFATMFTLREYPSDIWPLYAQGYSVVCFLIAQEGPQNFVRFLEAGMSNNDWVTATQQFYNYPKIGKLQLAWNEWVAEGGGDIRAYTAASKGYRRLSQNDPRLDGNIRMASANGYNQAPNYGIANVGNPNSGNSGYGNPNFGNANVNNPNFGNQGRLVNAAGPGRNAAASLGQPGADSNAGYYQQQLQANANRGQSSLPDLGGAYPSEVVPNDMPPESSGLPSLSDATLGGPGSYPINR